MKAGNMKNTDTLSFSEARDALGLTEGTFRRVVARREIGFRRTGSGRGWLRFDQQHVEEYRRSREVPARVHERLAA
jgi:excisionase family DNA binding protein